ncbi:MAG: leucine--tRNA ligase [Bdellovibrionota bacterium]
MAQSEFSFKDFSNSIEKKWQDSWESQGVYRAAQPGEKGSEKPKYYCLDMFPYPSGQGLHVGHPLGYIATDILCRYKRMRGFNVLHPMGWDAFGLPAEQYAIQTGIHPSLTTKKNAETFRRQLRSLGLGYDWSREISTADPKYYKWTQWIFKKLCERGLAYQAEFPVNWCPALGTVLANDEVIDGKSERGGYPVEKRPMRQWMLKITGYAERLLQDLETLDWPESTKEHQRNWIGRSEGAQIRFALASSPAKGFNIFTTRADTLMGVTFMVLAPEHPLIDEIATAEQLPKLKAFQSETLRKSDIARTDLNKDKAGIFTGAYATHPISGKKIPIWVADYVLMNYGTGAIMAVPSDDERDEEFAGKHGLEVVPVIDENGRLINSDSPELKVNGLPYLEAQKKITAYLSTKGVGEAKITYKLRDWVFSRQRYWGEPIPALHPSSGAMTGPVKLLEDAELPLILPPVERYEPSGTGESPLSTLPEWFEVSDKTTGTKYLRETNTMPGSAGSSWYFLRYMDPHNESAAWSKAAVDYWQNVDFYLGGSEHAVGHLLYSRFWHKVLFDMGLVPTIEPFKKLVHQGLMAGEDGEKMSKSRGNVINPDDIVRDYGADTFRLYEMFMGPLEKAKPWQTGGIEGVYRYLSRVSRMLFDENQKLSKRVVDIESPQWPEGVEVLLHRTVKQVGEDIEKLGFNTSISALMIFQNEIQKAFGDAAPIPRELVEKYVLLLAPFAPHMCEELWAQLGHKDSVVLANWPSYDASKTVLDEIEIGVQVNGKLRASLKIPVDVDEAKLKEQVLALEAVQKWMEAKPLKKFVYVKGRIVSVVV